MENVNASIAARTAPEPIDPANRKKIDICAWRFIVLIQGLRMLNCIHERVEWLVYSFRVLREKVGIIESGMNECCFVFCLSDVYRRIVLCKMWR